MKYLTTKEVALKWNVNDRRVRVLCEEGRVDGAFKVGKTWMIAETASKPYDARTSIKKDYTGLTYDISQIEALKKAIDQLRPLSPHAVTSLREKTIVDWTYHTNAIEGGTLTLSETKVVLEGLTIGGKNMVEHLEVINHKEAILFMETIIQEKQSLSESMVKGLHQLILKEIDHQNAGAYRRENVTISGANHIPPHHLVLPELMQKLIVEYQMAWHEYHPIIRACLLHGEFVKIHPFVDGNGRTARLLLNFELMKHGYPPIVITKDKRAEYYEALDLAHTTGNYSTFIDLIAGFLLESAFLWLRILG
jgi:Fic family protein